MRIRPLAALSAAALSALVLAGCSGSGEPDATPSPTSTSDSACLLDAQPGADSDAVEITGSGADLAATVPDSLAFEDVQRTVTTEGSGDDLAAGALVSGFYSVYDGSSGELLQDSSDTSPDDSGEVPILLDPQSYSLFVATLECAPLGSTIAMTIPGSAFGEGGSPVVVVAETTELIPTTAGGEEQEPVDGLPTVEFSEEGAPTISIPDSEPPTEVQLEQLKTGDGPVVEPGDTVFVQYTGAKWSDGSVFDSSWERGQPAAFATTGVVEGFQQALEGQAVGSQVLVVIPPAFGYGEGEINDADLTGETLVFVVDILGVQRAAAAQ
ncbi:FKBP-type peptidyl-prolyl cis-trans isomerase [Microbacterium atlanticum]|uniref:FKBP-type peptidyl-prolyl cis-trans isomerase n=1 Tax=Microbacterium atlanticum TaxID=2782168 RepID=UPI0018882C78|nr:FKBP-type peptidyl-prolyl cis-trans isomerase [Microbacterium atlanticum]